MNDLLKTLLAFAHPLGLVWLLLTLATLGAAARRSWRQALLPGLAWLVLSLFTCTPFSSWLLARLENHQPAVRMEELPRADVVVCLGGGAEPSLSEPSGVHLKTGADRLLTAMALISNEKAPALVLGGGGYPHQGQMLAEADALVEPLRGHVPAGVQVFSLGLCADTHDEALKVLEMMHKQGWRRVLLVTSAYHMPRSVAVFAKIGVPVLPVPCNYQSSFNRVGDLRWLHLPHVSGLENFAIWFHEIIGQLVYSWRGWV